MIKSFRLRYFFGHLLISLLIALVSLYLVFFVWYPAPFDVAVGVEQIILIMLGIDVTLGPLLTLVLAKEGKKGLKFDLVVIAIVQLLALFYGLYSVEKGRPVWVAFDHSRFELVQKFMIDREKDKDVKVPPAYQKEGFGSPSWVSVRPPKDREEQDDWMFYELETGTSPAMRPALYAPLSENMDRVIKEKLPLSDLNKFNNKPVVEPILAKYPNVDGFLPMRTSEVDMVVLVDSKDKSFMKVVDLRPW
ncbi:TfpX/TfpZ family type IV pilin accessory protein [Moraxella sp. ZY210820]|uniref:TfpX/TfpZ family type IV pilin accessory protein n=1 Tax=unclassified Moraxella TaxID=2685852 RepID=UPI0027300A28|nr:TfpX/TfpZ family type IV pilin accessory protein [Moraxella sp. ZY210820]WLF84171.1 type IV pilin accessory protein [Moraxella sp. ZY210820]